MVLLACSLSFCYTKSDTNTMINIDRKIRKDFAMWIADQWKDYEIIDTSKGEKLERWGDYLLVRPDPQVIWDTPKTHKGWKKMNGHYHRSKRAAVNGSFSICRNSGPSSTRP